MKKYIILFTFLLVSTICFGQSKKEQIERLSGTIDSLNTVLIITRDNSAKEINSLIEKMNKILIDVSVLKNELANLQNSNNNLIKENEKLKADLDEFLKKNLDWGDFKYEVGKWKTELILNQQVGPPCIDDYNKWMQENPSYYWGIQDLQSKIFDINTDGVTDGLFFFPAQNCVGGNGLGSDFAILIYSDNGNFRTDKNITKTIEDKIKISHKGINDVSKTYIHYENLNKYIKGTFFSYRENDGSCCPSLSGSFEFNPFDLKLSLKYIE